jgi:hypothetical protein
VTPSLLALVGPLLDADRRFAVCEGLGLLVRSSDPLELSSDPLKMISSSTPSN